MISIEEKSSRQNSCKKNFLIIPSLDYPHLDKEIDFLYSAFRKTCFSDHVSDHLVYNDVKKKFFGCSPSAEGEEPRPPTISLPYNPFVKKYVQPLYSLVTAK